MSKKKSSVQDLSEEQMGDLKEAFAMFDINGDGTSLLQPLYTVPFCFSCWTVWES
jgi:Ca2+-binding EF-hand superfamily protein